jgi:hypothetical protein
MDAIGRVELRFIQTMFEGRGGMFRTLIIVMVLLFPVSTVSADEGKKLTNTELKQITSKTLFVAGKSVLYGGYAEVMFPNGTRQVAFTNGVKSGTGEGKWRIDGDRMCANLEQHHGEYCNEWRRNGERISYGSRGSYFYILE